MQIPVYLKNTPPKYLTNPHSMVDYPDSDEQEDDDSNMSEPPAYMSQPKMQVYIEQLETLIGDLYEDTLSGDTTVELTALCDVLRAVHHQIVQTGKVEEMISLFRVLYRGALDEENPTAWDDLIRVPMTTKN